jgi:hypothetical protein
VGVRTTDSPSRGRRPDARARPSAPRTTARPGPLVARADLGTRNFPAGTARPPRARARGGRVRRFVRRYGWRAYAVPLLTVATLITLGDLAANGGTPSSAASEATATSSSPAAGPSAGETSAALPSAVGEEVPDGAVAGEAAPGLESAVGAESYVEKGPGTVSIVDVSSRVYGKGPLRRFVVEVEDGIGVDGAVFAKAVRSTLADPRSWGNGGKLSFQEVDAAAADAGQYDFRVALVSPGNMDSFCPGLHTLGYTSCRVGERAVINLARWSTAVPDYQGDIATYRHYVVNHEVGHALGHGHEQCPGPGAVAPVMQQQTLGLKGCVKNAWPFP